MFNWVVQSSTDRWPNFTWNDGGATGERKRFLQLCLCCSTSTRQICNMGDISASCTARDWQKLRSCNHCAFVWVCRMCLEALYVIYMRYIYISMAFQIQMFKIFPWKTEGFGIWWKQCTRLRSGLWTAQTLRSCAKPMRSSTSRGGQRVKTSLGPPACHVAEHDLVENTIIYIHLLLIDCSVWRWLEIIPWFDSFRKIRCLRFCGTCSKVTLSIQSFKRGLPMVPCSSQPLVTIDAGERLGLRQWKRYRSQEGNVRNWACNIW